MNFSKISILGPGLLGGSIALALRARQPDLRIAMWSRRELAETETRGLGDCLSTDLEAVVREANLVILCVPIGAMPALAERIARHLAPGAIVTDVGSVKACVVDVLTPIFSGRAHFVGSHPMAGSEQTGLAAARADLFENSVCILTPHAGTDRGARERVSDFWQILGARVEQLSPLAHDEIVARVSHLPHLLAAALVNLAGSEEPDALGFAGPGFRDTTRVASGPPAMWAEILLANRAAVSNSANAMIEKLRAVLKLLDADDARALEQFLADAKTRRDELKKNIK